ncbi:MAG: bifunctional diguanylate cyclase/phosphodiesterase [Lachnospiraceae bacterium]|nr:bifunctional diguanylate cyclase/phosphodiesterase [Lachnospiraceae bacterium]
MNELLSGEKLRYYKEMVSTFPCAAFVSRDDRRMQVIEVLCANSEYYTLTGIAPDAIEFGDHDITNLADIATEDKIRINREFGEAVKNRTTVATDASVKRIDGSYMRCRIHARPLETIGDSAIFVVTFHRYDDKDPETIIKRHYVEHDALTNIFNMKGFCQQTAEVLATYPERRFTIVVSDIDSFKTINNMFGDEVGDTILKKIGCALKERFAQLFKDNVPGSYGRIGSDRFAVMLPSDMVNPERIVEQVDEVLFSMDLNYRMIVHYGLCNVPEGEFDVTDLIEEAYLACSTVKHNLAVRFAWYDDNLRKTLLEEQELVAQAEKALRNGEFVPYFQPVYLANTENLISAEALVRWNHPEKGLLEPGRFVPIMERNGFISHLDKYIWEKVLAFMHERQKNGKKLVPVSVNMSRQDIFHAKLADELLNLLDRYEIDPAYFHIEVTESAYIDEEVQAQLAETIHRLREKGFIILMDDFGSGYSSLNVLKDMPIDIMKIDRGLTFDIETSERGKAMLATIVRLANRLYIPIIAEGVETEEQYDFLKEIGCDSIQGYYFSRPVSEEEFAELLDNSDVPEYVAGESIPGRFVHRALDNDPQRDRVLVIGEDTPGESLKNLHRVIPAKDAEEGLDRLKEDEEIGYILLSREALKDLMQKGGEI